MKVLAIILWTLAALNLCFWWGVFGYCNFTPGTQFNNGESAWLTITAIVSSAALAYLGLFARWAWEDR